MVSVVIPTYNSENFLCACLNSTINQTYKNIEIIIVDGGSTDNTCYIVETFQNKYKNIFLYHSNKGVSNQRNFGLVHSKGEYILFLDSDDYIDVDFIDKCSKYFGEYDIIIPKLVNAIDDQISIKNIDYIYSVYMRKVSINNYFNGGYKNGLIPVQKLYKSTLIKNTSFDTKLAFGEDLFFNYEIAKKTYTVKYELNTSYYHRCLINLSTISKSANKSITTFFEKLVKLINEIPQDNKENYLGALSIYDETFNNLYHVFLSKAHHLPSYMFKYQFFYFKKHKNIKTFIYCFFPHLFQIMQK